MAELPTEDQNTAQLQELKNDIRRLSGKVMAAPVRTRQSPTGSPSMSKRVSFAPEQSFGYAVRAKIMKITSSNSSSHHPSVWEAETMGVTRARILDRLGFKVEVR